MEPILYEAIQREEWAYGMAITLSFVLTKCIPSNCPAFRGAVAIFGPKFVAVPLFIHSGPLYCWFIGH